MVTGLDLVQLQLKTAAGDPLPFTQEQISHRGHCIEVRIYAETPSSGFMPSVGRLHRWIEPQGAGIRVDSGVEEGDLVSPYYDPMLAKLIVYAESREHALRRLRAALDEFCVLGIDTNIAYLQAIVDNAIYRSGAATTRLLADSFATWAPPEEIPTPVLLALAANALQSGSSRERCGKTGGSERAVSPWQAAGSWRNS
jgi:3-methylcrotonyl-CoA carboxylase alpha subunit